MPGGEERFPGMMMTYALMERLSEIADTTPTRAVILNKATATRLITLAGDVIGVEYYYKDKTHMAYGPVVLATGTPESPSKLTPSLRNYILVLRN